MGEPTTNDTAFERYVLPEIEILLRVANSLTRNHAEAEDLVLHFERTSVQPRSPMQASYLRAIAANDIVFGIGPAGTGKTYLAVAMAVNALKERTVDRVHGS